MIRTFKHKGLEAFWETGKAGKLPVQNSKRVARILNALEAAERPEDLDTPGYFFHELRGARKGTYSLRATGNWRITYEWRAGDVFNIDMEDYH
jgi:proteic killer suppression protein